MKQSKTGNALPYDRTTPRREFLKSGLAAAAALGLESALTPARLALGAKRAARGLTVERIERVTVEVPYREVPERAMNRELPHWRFSEIFEVHLRSGHVGFGETLLYYTWGVTDADDVARTIGQNAASFMWDDSLGAGLQMALFDAVARTVGVPIHRLLGRRKYERTPLSWWNIDMPPADVAAECEEALRTGYLSYKTKGRPWFDVWDQVEQACKVVPESFKVDMDFNDTLLDAERAIPILKELEQYPQIDIYETPIPQSDIAGNQAIRAATRVNIAMHYGNPDPEIALKEEICDGFVVGGGASSVMEQGAVCAMADKPFWLQLVGTGLTAAFSLHFGAVLSHARWPAVNCHQLYTHPMLTKSIPVNEGFANVPNKPGMGYEIDTDAIEEFRVDKPSRRPDPPRLIETSWPDGRKMFIANNGQVNFMHGPAKQGKYPFYERGVKTRLVPNDGSAEWQQLYDQAREAPLIKGE